MWPPNAKLPISAQAVLNGRCRARLDMSRFSPGVVLRGLPARGRSLTWFCKKNKQVLCDDLSLNRELIDTNVKEDLSNYEIVTI